MIPLTLYQSSDSVLDYSISESEAILGTNSFLGDGPIISWADECDSVVDFASTGPDLECAPSVVTLLAMEILAGSKSNLMEVVEGNPVEGGGPEKVDSSQLSLWVINIIKAFRKSVGTSSEGFEEQVTDLFLALEAKKKNFKKKKKNKKSKLHEEGSQKKMEKVGQKGHRELKILVSTWSGENESNRGRSVSRDQVVVFHQ